jgi:hypothetical protein
VVDTFYTWRCVRGERLAWLVTLPIAVIGCESAHAVANFVFGTADGDGPFFRTTARNGDLVTLVVSLAAVSIVLGLAGRTAGAWSSHRTAAARLPFALLAPAAFVVQEHLETLLHSGAPFATVLHATFLAGLALQIPFALAGYAIARALVRLADGVRALIDRRRRTAHTAGSPPKARPAYRTPPSSAAHSWAHSGRAPPRTASAPA